MQKLIKFKKIECINIKQWKISIMKNWRGETEKNNKIIEETKTFNKIFLNQEKKNFEKKNYDNYYYNKKKIKRI